MATAGSWKSKKGQGGWNRGLRATPPASMCARTDGVCCKELIHDERTLIDPDVIRDVVIGLSDGLTVPFALTAGLSSLGESKLVVLGGIAELIAGAISMGIGGFLASQAETAQRVHHSCEGEMEREVAEVLTCHAVAKCLRDVEEDQSMPGYINGQAVRDVENNKLRWSTEIGLTAFLLKFGQEWEVPNRRMYISAFTLGIGYLLGGIIPLIPYFFIARAHVALIYSSIVTGIVLLIFGAIKARITGAAQSPGGYIWGAFSTLMVGGIAAAAAFGIVRALEAGGD
ncbi:VIT family-domain-containing protein [Gymnopilus junonius]|uniref:VIT family-domain-containing protein n=1 Tax=Gymnopilus junonius TaxID=109634 RepID=A0A9P5N9H3_GYMJU|nr:VIT family-domain-containing protein [Gymnopilus junonius]